MLLVAWLARLASWLAGWLDGMSVLTGMCGCQAMNLKNVNECYFIATLAFDAKKDLRKRSFIHSYSLRSTEITQDSTKTAKA